jgi:large subunit ribosomal protein L30
MSKIKVSQKLSLIGKTKKQISCIKGLGLRRIRDSRIIEASPENLGMIETVKHMVNVEQIKE